MIFYRSEVQDKFSLLKNVNYPIENGVITNWDNMEKFLIIYLHMN